MEENELYDRIGETDLNPTYKDGQPYMHTDINQMLGILKTAINENYYDIQRLLNGAKTVGNANQLDGATLSRYIDEELQSDDNKIPSSQQAKAYMDALFAGYSAPVRGVDYWTEADQQQIVSDTASNVIEKITPDLEETLNAKANINDIPTKVSDLTNDSEFITSLEMQESQSEQDTKINKKPYYFNSVADMKATNLKAGDCAITLGYYTSNDGGAGTYKIVNETLTDDGGSIHELNNGLFAKLIIENNTINIKQFGAKGDGTTDDSLSIQNALRCKGNESSIIIFNSNETYIISSGLKLFSNTTIDLNNSIIKTIADTTIKSDQSLVESAGYTGIQNLIIKNGTLDGNKIGIIIALLHANNVIFENVKFLDCCTRTHIIDMGGCKDITIKNCDFIGCYISDAQYTFREMVQIDFADSANMPYWNQTGTLYDSIPTKNVVIDNCRFDIGEGTTYPTAIGTHSTANTNETLDNIKITNCVFGDFEKANIIFTTVSNLIIDNNIFNNASNIIRRTSDGNLFKINISGTNTLPSKNIIISNNKFNNEYDTSIKSILHLGGVETNVTKNISIYNNIFIGNYDSGSSSDSADFIQANSIVNVNINNNYIENAKNIFLKFNDATVDEINIIDNTFKNCRDYWKNVDSTDTKSNAFVNLENNSIIKNNKYLNTSKSNIIVGFSEDVVLDTDITRLPINTVLKGDEFVSVNNDHVVLLPYYLNKLRISGYFTITNNSASARTYVFTLRKYDTSASLTLETFSATIGAGERKCIIIPTVTLEKIDLSNLSRTLYINGNIYNGDKLHYSETKINIDTI